MGQGSEHVSLSDLRYRLILAVLLTLLIGGCATSPPAPIIDVEPSRSTTTRRVEPVPNVTDLEALAPRLEPQSPVSKGTIAAVTATRQLLAAVENHIEQRDYDAAAAGLERILRINPEDAWAWHKLAELQFAQNDYAQAKATAHRSNALPQATARTVAANWFLIADVERATGDESAAKEAYAKAKMRLNDAFNADRDN